MAEEKKDTGFKVSDRRLFTADGELRTDSAEEEYRTPAQAPETPAAAKVARPSCGRARCGRGGYARSADGIAAAGAA